MYSLALTEPLTGSKQNRKKEQGWIPFATSPPLGTSPPFFSAKVYRYSLAYLTAPTMSQSQLQLSRNFLHLVFCHQDLWLPDEKSFRSLCFGHSAFRQSRGTHLLFIVWWRKHTSLSGFAYAFNWRQVVGSWQDWQNTRAASVGTYTDHKVYWLS